MFASRRAFVAARPAAGARRLRPGHGYRARLDPSPAHLRDGHSARSRLGSTRADAARRRPVGTAGRRRPRVCRSRPGPSSSPASIPRPSCARTRSESRPTSAGRGSGSSPASIPATALDRAHESAALVAAGRAWPTREVQELYRRVRRRLHHARASGGGDARLGDEPDPPALAAERLRRPGRGGEPGRARKRASGIRPCAS